MRSRPGKVSVRSSPEELLGSGILLPDGAADALDLTATFGNRRPVEVEVGPGKGNFLLRRARQRPELNLLGVEWVRPYALYAADRARRAGLDNVRILCTDARALFRAALGSASLWRIHVYFPDPWPKRRHHRRRLITPDFLRRAAETLHVGGWIGIATDHADYFRQIRLSFRLTPLLAEVPFLDPLNDPRDPLASSFRRKYADGKVFHTIAGIRYR